MRFKIVVRGPAGELGSAIEEAPNISIVLECASEACLEFGPPPVGGGILVERVE